MTDKQLIDKLILEWSWRCEKGYPDINNPADKKILDKLLEGYGINTDTSTTQTKKQQNLLLRENLQNIQTLLSKGEYDEKFLSRLQRMLLDYEEVRQLKELLTKNGITKDTFADRDLPDEIVSILQRGPQSDIKEFVKYLKGTEAPKLALLPGKHNIYKTFPPPLFKKLTKLGRITGESSSVGMGRGEILFPLAFSNVELKGKKKGDLEVNGKNVELKALGVSVDGKPAKGARFGESRSGTRYVPVNKPTENDSPRIADQIYKDFEASKTNNNTQDVKTHVEHYIEKVYNTHASMSVPKQVGDVVNSLHKILISSYAKQKSIDYFLLYAPVEGDYAVYTPEQLLQAFQKKEVEVSAITNTAAIPQLKSF